jgi:hypothetical protein
VFLSQNFLSFSFSISSFLLFFSSFSSTFFCVFIPSCIPFFTVSVLLRAEVKSEEEGALESSGSAGVVLES